jgi:TRAP-type mannitol/chloroaromatic compound transport system permease large subunit
MAGRGSPAALGHKFGAAAPPDVPTLAIYKGVVPFICLQLVALVLVHLRPGTATWLPRAIGW